MARSLALVALLALAPAALAADPTLPASWKEPARPAVTGKQAGKEKLAQELLSILNETKSVDTFLITLEVLPAADIDPAVAIPTIIRNAERLELLDGFSKGERQDKAQECVGDALKHFCDKCEQGRRAPTRCCDPCYPERALIGGATGAATGALIGNANRSPDPLPAPVPAPTALPTNGTSFKVPAPR
jgi:hypothetical protein